MIWPRNGRPKAKGSIMTDDIMMTLWVRKGLITQSCTVERSSVFLQDQRHQNPCLKLCHFVLIFHYSHDSL